MRFYRLVKPMWGIPKKANGERNPKFKQAIPGPNVLEGADFSPEYLKQKNEEGFSLYFFPNHPSTNVYQGDLRFLNGRVIDTFNYAFADIDFKDGVYADMDAVRTKLSTFPIKPTMLVASGGGAHVYFKVSDLCRESYVALQLKLITFFQSDASVFTTLQLMRLPGSINTKKHEEFTLCRVDGASSSAKSCSTKELLKHLPVLSDELKAKARLHLDRLDGKIVVNFNRSGVNLDELPDRFLQILLTNSRLAVLFDNPENHSPQGDHAVAADMSLCHFLYTEEFSAKEALQIIANTQTALDKKMRRLLYAANTVEKVYHSRKTFKIQSVSDFLDTKDAKILEPQIMGPGYLDHLVLGDPWRRKELLGIISGSGVGKTTFALNIIHETISQNDNEDIYVFFTIEMTKGQIAKRWLQMVGEKSPLGKRLYVIDTAGADGKLVTIGLQEMYEMSQELMKQTGKRIGMIVMDHFHVLSTHIDTKKSPDFSIHSEQGTGFGEVRNLSLNGFAKGLRDLVVMLDTFGVILSQTTKAQGIGDTPIAKSGCYGCSQFEWIVSRILTIWQPVLRVQDRTPLRVLAFQYCKLREKNPADKIFEYDPKLLFYEARTGFLKGVPEEAYQEFLKWLPVADEMRRNAVKHAGIEYTVGKVA